MRDVSQAPDFGVRVAEPARAAQLHRRDHAAARLLAPRRRGAFLPLRHPAHQGDALLQRQKHPGPFSCFVCVCVYVCFVFVFFIPHRTARARKGMCVRLTDRPTPQTNATQCKPTHPTLARPHPRTHAGACLERVCRAVREAQGQIRRPLRGRRLFRAGRRRRLGGGPRGRLPRPARGGGRRT